MDNNNPLVDIHTHKNQTNSGIAIVNIILTNALKEKTNSSSLLIRENINPLVYFSIGIHPWFLEDWENQVKLLEKLAINPKVIAIGECGLDKNIETPMDRQIEIFNLQISLSEKLQKPLIIHCVKAYNELIQIRKTTKSMMPWIIHGFNSSLKIAEQCIESGMCLSLGKSIFNNTLKINNLIQWIPNSQVFMETDESDLPIEDVYRKYSEMKGISMEELKFIIVQNFHTYFKF